MSNHEDSSLARSGNVVRGRKQDAETKPAIVRREEDRRFNEKLKEFNELLEIIL